MEFEDRGAFKAWLAKQSQEVCVAIATRATLRVRPVLWADRSWKDTEKARAQQEELVLLTGWCNLISGVASTCPTPEIKTTAATAAATAAATTAAATTAATYADCGKTVEELFAAPLWHEAGPPDMLRPETLGPSRLDRDPRFEFFRRWYDGMAKGQPMDWELQSRVALIPEDVWKAGADSIAEAIAKIEAEWLAEHGVKDDRAQAFEPETAAHLFQYPRTITASLAFASVNIGSSLELFRRETGLNDTPDFLQPLEALPASLQRIGDILARGERSAVVEQTLREEIGKLQARVAALEAELAKAHGDLELQKKPWFGKLALLTGAIAAIPGVVWTVSGDELGPKKRCEMIAAYWEFFGGGTVVCERPAVILDMRELPKTTDT